MVAFDRARVACSTMRRIFVPSAFLLTALLAACSSSSDNSAHPTLVSTTAEPPGPNCPAGGVAVQSGRDDNKDGTLEAAEVDATSYVCQPSSSPTQLVRVDDEPAGANCTYG